MKIERFWWIMVLFLLFANRNHSAEEHPMNGGYEAWNGNAPAGWIIQGDVAGKTEEAFQGMFAVILNNWYEHLPGQIETGVEEEGRETPGFPMTKPLSLLTGYYKYLGSEECKAANADVIFYRASKKDPKLYEDIGRIHQNLPLVSKYTSFELKISSTEIPEGTERVSIRFETEGRCNSGTNNCCFLYLDEIRLVDHP